MLRVRQDLGINGYDLVMLQRLDSLLTGVLQDPPCEGDFCSCTYVLEVELGDTVELVLIDEGDFLNSSHPFHLHGNNFHVLAMERIGE